MSPCTVTALSFHIVAGCCKIPMVTRPSDSDDEHLKQEAIIPGNFIVGGEQASVDGTITQCVQGQSQPVVECGNVKVLEAATPLSFVGKN